MLDSTVEPLYASRGSIALLTHCVSRCKGGVMVCFLSWYFLLHAAITHLMQSRVGPGSASLSMSWLARGVWESVAWRRGRG